MTPEPSLVAVILQAMVGAVCLAVALNALGRRGGLSGMRLALTVLSLSAATGMFAYLGASFEREAAGAIAWHAVARACIGFIAAGAVSAAWVLVRPRQERAVPVLIGVGAAVAALGVFLALRSPPEAFVRTSVSWYARGLSLRVFDSVAVVGASLSVLGAALWRLGSGAPYGRGAMLLLVGMQSVVAAAYALVRTFASPGVMQTFGTVITGVSAVIVWGALHNWRAAGVGDSAFQLLFESIRVPALAIDLHADAALLNPAAKHLFGSDDSVTSILRRMGLEGSPRRVLERYAGSKLDDVRVDRVPGRNFELHVHFDRRTAIGLVLVVDVTERAEHASRLARSLSDLQQMQARVVMNEKMAAIGVLVAGVNHEINNPLAYTSANVRSVLELVEALLEGVPLARRSDSAEARAWAESLLVREAESDALPALREAVEGCARIQETVSSMRLLSRQHETEHLVDLAEIGRAGVRIGRTSFHPGIEVCAELDRPLPIRGVAGELTRVVTNLVVNAGQALGAQGRVTVRGFEEDDCAVLEVADDGPGVPPELRARIFEPFFTTKAPGVGTGLGLAISFETARRHRGELRLLEHTGPGACFQLRIPLSTEEKPLRETKGTESA